MAVPMQPQAIADGQCGQAPIKLYLEKQAGTRLGLRTLMCQWPWSGVQGSPVLLATQSHGALEMWPKVTELSDQGAPCWDTRTGLGRLS